jgi:hypothetical protein
MSIDPQFQARLKPLASPSKPSGGASGRGSGISNDFNFAAPVGSQRSHRRSVTEFHSSAAAAAATSLHFGQNSEPSLASATSVFSSSSSMAPLNVSIPTAPSPLASPVRPKHTRSLSDTSMLYSPSSPSKQELYSDRYEHQSLRIQIIFVHCIHWTHQMSHTESDLFLAASRRISKTCSYHSPPHRRVRTPPRSNREVFCLIF